MRSQFRFVMHDGAMPMSELLRETVLGASSVRPMQPCLDKCPVYKAESQQHTAGKDIVSNRAILPKAIGTNPRADLPRLRATAETSAWRRQMRPAACIEPFLTAPSPDVDRA